ncbi:DNA polymerase [Alphaproteobacteria bacterium]|nr:DNA polymerase [Alphaproteobacteria bacterium]
MTDNHDLIDEKMSDSHKKLLDEMFTGLFLSDTKSEGSDGLISMIFTADDSPFEIVHTFRKSKYRDNSSGFFRYNLPQDFPINLNDLGIYKKEYSSYTSDCKEITDYNNDIPHQESKYDSNCLIQCLEAAKVDHVKIERLKALCSTRYIPRRLLKDVARISNLYIHLRPFPGDGHTHKFGDKKNPKIIINDMKEHFFLEKQVPVTAYSIKNYRELIKTSPENWNRFRKKGEGARFDKTATTLTSSKLVKLLLEMDLLTPITDYQLITTLKGKKTDNLTAPQEIDSSLLNLSNYEPQKSKHLQVHIDENGAAFIEPIDTKELALLALYETQEEKDIEMMRIRRVTKVHKSHPEGKFSSIVGNITRKEYRSRYGKHCAPGFKYEQIKRSKKIYWGRTFVVDYETIQDERIKPWICAIFDCRDNKVSLDLEDIIRSRILESNDETEYKHDLWLTQQRFKSYKPNKDEYQNIISSGYPEERLKALIKRRKPTFHIISHNQSFDMRFLLEDFKQIGFGVDFRNFMGSASKFTGLSLENAFCKIELRCSYRVINAPLGKFAKMKLVKEVAKDVMPYHLLKQEFVDMEWCRVPDAFVGYETVKEKSQFLENLWAHPEMKRKDSFNLKEYTEFYCIKDVQCTIEGIRTFQSWINEMDKELLEICDRSHWAPFIQPIRFYDLFSAANLADTLFKRAGVYSKTHSLYGPTRAFVQKFVSGGRVALNRNEMWHVKTIPQTQTAMHIKDETIVIDRKGRERKIHRNYLETHSTISDFDGVSLYPSAQSRLEKELGGFLIGEPKIIEWEDDRKKQLDSYDGYFVRVKILEVGQKRDMPLQSLIDERGIKVFTNDLEGHVLYLDKIGLEDLIKFQRVKFELIDGVYYDQGRDPRIGSVIRYLFNRRLQFKEEENPAQSLLKLIMNSSYGITGLKPIETSTTIFSDREKCHEKALKHFDYLQSISHNDDIGLHFMEEKKPLCAHSNRVHLAVEILSMSKRIMNEVMSTIEDIGARVFISDTDSMHIETDIIPKLDEKFQERYGRELIGKDLGQFHTDFELKKGDDKAKNVISTELIAIAKKVYWDRLEGVLDGKTIKGVHRRIKGIPEKSILAQCRRETGVHDEVCTRQAYLNAFDLHQEEFDLLDDGSKTGKFSIQYSKNFTAKQRKEMKRNFSVIRKGEKIIQSQRIIEVKKIFPNIKSQKKMEDQRKCICCDQTKSLVSFKIQSTRRISRVCADCFDKEKCRVCEKTRHEDDHKFTGKRCSKCHNDYQRNRIVTKTYPRVEEACCKSCNKQKPGTEFQRARGCKKGVWTGKCRHCIKTEQKEIRERQRLS